MKKTKSSSYEKYRSDYYMNLNMMMQKQIEGIVYTAMENGLAPDPVTIQEALQTVMDQGMATLSMVDRLMNYMNLIGGENLEERVYDVRELVEGIERENDLSRGMGLQIEFQIQEDMLPQLFGDDMRIRYVVNGFLGHCYNRMKSGTIRVLFSAVQRSYAFMLTITIIDGGDPMEPELIEMIRKYVRKGDLFSVERTDTKKSDHGFSIFGYLMYQMSGKVHFKRDEKKNLNMVTLEIPQLAVQLT